MTSYRTHRFKDITVNTATQGGYVARVNAVCRGIVADKVALFDIDENAT